MCHHYERTNFYCRPAGTQTRNENIAKSEYNTTTAKIRWKIPCKILQTNIHFEMLITIIELKSSKIPLEAHLQLPSRKNLSALIIIVQISNNFSRGKN